MSLSTFTVNVASCDASDAFFLRPYLTREEYSYWNSHLSHFSSSCACSCACAPNPKDNTIVTYQYTEPPVGVRNATDSPYIKSLLVDGCPVVRGKSTIGSICRKIRPAPKPSVPEKVVSTKNCRIIEANDPVCSHLTNTSCNKRSTSISKDKGFFETTSLKKKSAPIHSQTESSSSKKSLNSRDSTKKNHQELSAESRRRISEKYLCGDRSFEENPSARVTPTRYDNVQSGSADQCYSTGTVFGARSDLGSADSRPGKRKSTSETEHERYRNGDSKRQCLGDDGHGNNEREAPNETIDLNDTLEIFLSGPLARDNCHDEGESFNNDESRETLRSKEANKSGGMAKTFAPPSSAREDVSPQYSDGGCEVNDNVQKVIYEPNSKMPLIAQPKKVPSDALADVAVESRYGGQALTDGKSPSERKDIGDIFNAEKPIQRKLLKSTKSSRLCGSYALDYESLPKLISVLSTPMAKAVSSLTIS